MADFTIAADEQGAYEIPLEANTPTTIQVDAQNGFLTGTIRVTHHGGNKPIYVRKGNTTAGDAAATMIPAYTWADVYSLQTDTISLTIVSADDAVVSVARQ